jgi:hypothetical protein
MPAEIATPGFAGFAMTFYVLNFSWKKARDEGDSKAPSPCGRRLG